MMPPKYDGMERMGASFEGVPQSKEWWVRRVVPDAQLTWVNTWYKITSAIHGLISDAGPTAFHIDEAWHSAYLSPVVQSVVLRDGEKESIMDTISEAPDRVKLIDIANRSSIAKVRIALSAVAPAVPQEPPTEDTNAKAYAAIRNGPKCLNCDRTKAQHILDVDGEVLYCDPANTTGERRVWRYCHTPVQPPAENVGERHSRWETMDAELLRKSLEVITEDNATLRQQLEKARRERDVHKRIADSRTAMVQKLTKEKCGGDWYDLTKEDKARLKLSAMAGGEMPELETECEVCNKTRMVMERPGKRVSCMACAIPCRDEIERQLISAQAIIAAQGEQLKYAMHFFDSPASFSNEEFKGVAEKVYADGRTYIGKCPHLDERESAELELAGLRERLGELLKSSMADPNRAK